MVRSKMQCNKRFFYFYCISFMHMENSHVCSSSCVLLQRQIIIEGRSESIKSNYHYNIAFSTRWKGLSDCSYTSSDHFEIKLAELTYLVSLHGAIESTMVLRPKLINFTKKCIGFTNTFNDNSNCRSLGILSLSVSSAQLKLDCS